MNKLKIVSIVTGVLVCSMFLFPAIALADAPPDTEVSVTVISSGDVNADLTLVAGGDLDVSVNGDGLATTEALAVAGECMGGLSELVNTARQNIIILDNNITVLAKEISAQRQDIQSLIAQLTVLQSQMDDTTPQLRLYGDAIAKLIVSLQALQDNLGRLSALQTSAQVTTQYWVGSTASNIAAVELSIMVVESRLQANIDKDFSDVELLKGKDSELQQKYDELSKSTSDRFTLLTAGFALLVLCGLILLIVLVVGRKKI